MASAANVAATLGAHTVDRRSRPWLRLLAVVWIVLLAAAVAGTAASALQIERHYQAYVQPFQALGLRWGEDDHNELWVADGSAAARGVIISVQGYPAPNAWNAQVEVGRLLATAPGPIVRVQVRSADGVVRDLALSRRPEASLMSLQHRLWVAGAVGLTLLQVVLTFAGVLLFVRAPRQPAAVLYSVAYLLQAASGLRGNFVPIELLWGPFALAPPLLAALGLGANFLAMLVFPEGKLDPPWIRWMIPVAAAYCAVLALHGYGYGVVAAPWLALAYVGLFLLGVAVQVWRYRRLSAGAPRQQIRWALFGVCCAAVFVSAAFAVILWPVDDPVLAAWLGAAWPVLLLLGVTSHVAGFVVSLLRYRLYDADMVISRSAAFAVITVGLAAVWAGAERGLEVVLVGRFGHEAEAVSVGLAATLAALLIKPMHERVSGWTERLFRKALAHLRRDLPPCMADLRETASPPKIAAVALERISYSVRADQGAVVLDDGRGLKLMAVHGVSAKVARDWLRDAAAELVGHERLRGAAGDLFPLRLPLSVANDGPREVIGWLLLGARPDGSFYGGDELDTLHEVADPVARALQIARVRQVRERAQDRRLANLEAQISARFGEISSELADLREAVARLAPA